MRSVVLIAALVCAGSTAQAQDTRESRYGPRPDRATAALNAPSPYAGPMLSWSGKQQPQATVYPQASVPMAGPRTPSAPPPLSEPWRNLGARPPVLAAAAPVTSQALPLQALPPMSEPWRNLGARPASPAPPQVQAPAPAQGIVLAGGPPAPQAQAQAQAQTQTQSLAPSLSRTYSVGRQYGLQPDALPPLKPNGMVLIAPSEDAPRLSDDEPRHGSAEWLAAGARGDEDADLERSRNERRETLRDKARAEAGSGSL